MARGGLHEEITACAVLVRCGFSILEMTVHFDSPLGLRSIHSLSRQSSLVATAHLRFLWPLHGEFYEYHSLPLFRGPILYTVPRITRCLSLCIVCPYRLYLCIHTYPLSSAFDIMNLSIEDEKIGCTALFNHLMVKG